MNRRLIMCQGLPGSGKTTWASDAVYDSSYDTGNPALVVRVNKDAIRRELEAYGWVWSHEREANVLDIRDSRIVEAFKQGAATVISDDTNFGRRHKADLERLAKTCGAAFEVKRFDTPIEECIRRDSLRTGKARVGESVIRAMAAKYHLAGAETGLEAPIPVKVDPSLPHAVICDLDGTLSLLGSRNPYDASTCDQDAVNVAVLFMLRAVYSHSTAILFVSGRFDTFRPQTDLFLQKHHVPPGQLFMRRAGDTRRDDIIKSELFDQHIRGKYHVLFVLDDRDRVVKFWRSIGLQCWQVAEGDF